MFDKKNIGITLMFLGILLLLILNVRYENCRTKHCVDKSKPCYPQKCNFLTGKPV